MDSPVAITIFGRHVASWMRALEPDAAVWSHLPAVRSVRVLEPGSDHGRLMPEAGEARPVLIPLLEPHIRARPHGYFVLCPSRQALETFADKKRFATFAEACGLQALCPTAYETIEDAVFPLVAKPTDLNAGTGIRLLEDRAQYDALSASPIWHEHRYVLQEFIDELDDYCTHLFCRDGEIAWYKSYRFRLAEGARIRGPVRQPGEDHDVKPRQLADMLRFLAPLNYSGPCNVDYKILPDGSTRIMEINPRLGGSLFLPENVAYLARTIDLTIRYGTLETNGE